MEKELFALLRLGLGISSTEHENLSDFIMMHSEQWVRLGDIALGQGVLGIVLDGVERIDATSYGPTRELSKEKKLEWIGQVMQMEQRNRHQIEVMNNLAQKWINEDCRVMVMKGQANSLLYPRPEHRSPGDIDCFLINENANVNDNHNENSGYAIGNEVARTAGAKVDEGWYKHSQISYKDELFENHLYFVHTREGRRSKQLQGELEQALCVKDWSYFPESKVLLPPVQWNAMFLTYHACAHFLSEGLRLKQILDWAMFLKAYQNDVDWASFYTYCERYHFRRFADAMTAISVNCLGIKIENPAIIADSPYIGKILKSTLYDEDYIYNAGESIWKSRLHVVRSLFKYRWKYEEIYQESVWKQLWWYASGFLFHTDKSE